MNTIDHTSSSDEFIDSLIFCTRFLVGESSDVKISKDLMTGAVLSPVSVWVLLALSLRASQKEAETLAGDDLTGLQQRVNELSVSSMKALRMDLQSVSSVLDSLPERLVSRVKAWGNEEYGSWIDAAENFFTVSRSIPDKAELDEWIEENTEGIITSFPLDPADFRPDVVIAHAVVSNLVWRKPFKVSDSGGDARWGVSSFLRGKSDWRFNVLDFGERGKVLALFKPSSASGEAIVMFVPEDGMDVSSLNLYEFMLKNCSAESFSFSLPAGFKLQDFGWGVSEVCEMYNDWTEVVLPAWEVDGRFNLSEATEVRNVFYSAFGDSRLAVEQVAKARFEKEGFKAAASTVSMIAVTGMPVIGFRDSHTVVLPPGFGFVVLGEAGIPVFVGSVGKSDALESEFEG